MTGKPRRQDWHVLGLEPGANHRDVRRSYRQRRALYASDSLATYALLEDDERSALLERIDQAFQRIIGTPAPTTQSDSQDEEIPRTPSGPLPSANEEPGSYLRHHRHRAGMLLNEIAEEIKVRTSLLEQIEGEMFEHLPAAVYVRGFVVQYAKVLKLAEPDRIAAAYVTKLEMSRNKD
jgi:flagellar biosynthesis protein FlhG